MKIDGVIFTKEEFIEKCREFTDFDGISDQGLSVMYDDYADGLSTSWVHLKIKWEELNTRQMKERGFHPDSPINCLSWHNKILDIPGSTSKLVSVC